MTPDEKLREDVARAIAQCLAVPDRDPLGVWWHAAADAAIALGLTIIEREKVADTILSLLSPDAEKEEGR